MLFNVNLIDVSFEEEHIKSKSIEKCFACSEWHSNELLNYALL